MERKGGSGGLVVKKVLLDTNAYIGLLAGDEQVLAVLSGAEHVFMTIFVLGELYAGFKGGTRERENKSRLAAFLSKPTVMVLDATNETAQVFGDIKHQLKISGHPLPLNDVWIAAHAMENGLLLITYDDHFTKVPGLRLWDDLRKTGK
jgi:tRNA(fMet)-specific endonuclease VapC